jgi:hypothetical protein
VSEDQRLELLNLCHASVLVSLWEGSGLPALEVMERLGRERFLLWQSA